MFKLIRKTFFEKCRFADPKCKAFDGGGILKCSCGKSGKAPSPAVPAYQMPSYAQGLPEEQLALIRSMSGKQAAMPQEYDIASQALQGLLGTQADQFQLPIQQIQDALAAQQGIQYQDYLKEIRPVMAAQGQLDSSGYTNRISDFLQGQQAQSYGSNADLLTQQALQNLQLQQWVPQFQSGIAGQLAGLGGQKSALDQFNLQLPFQTTIPALGSVYGQGMQLGDKNYDSAMKQYQQAMQEYEQQQQQQQALYKTIGMVSPLGGAIYGGISGGGQGFASSLSGTVDSAKLMAQLYGASQGMPSFPSGGQYDWGQQSSRYNPNWSRQSNVLGFNTMRYA